ncbi:MAG: LysM peptidoglycan-binding domain-containing protein [Ruminococcaceae bacterium]|nr:LysM peptidoglycan-binding domain-containing protein [Oscillospiraceae bacterium]
MLIHTVSEGEGIFSIAAKYAVPVTKLIEDNDITDGHTVTGEELLVLRPTKTKTIQGGDTVDGICRRYGIRKSALLASNPALRGNERLRTGRVLTIKQDSPVLGAATAMGTAEWHTPVSFLTRILPYVTYLRINAAQISEDKAIKLEYNPERTVSLCHSEGKLPLLGISDKSGGAFLDTGEGFDQIINAMTDAARSLGCKGICLSAKEAAEIYPDRFCEFIMQMRKKFIGCDLILFTDIFEGTPNEASELSDGGVLILPFVGKSELYRRLSDFSANAESSKVLVSLITEANMGEARISLTEAKELCRKSGGRISRDEDSLISYFDYTKYRGGVGERMRITLPSPTYTKAKLEMISELGFMGISIGKDIVPAYALSMFNALFSRADYTLP